MALTVQDVHHIAQLARLELTDEEEQRFAAQLSDVLANADRLSKVDTSVLPLRAPLRPDTVRPCLSRDDVLANAPHTEDGMFRVPRVLA